MLDFWDFPYCDNTVTNCGDYGNLLTEELFRQVESLTYLVISLVKIHFYVFDKRLVKEKFCNLHKMCQGV